MPARLCPYCHAVSNFSRNSIHDGTTTPGGGQQGEKGQISLDGCQNCNAIVYFRANGSDNGQTVYDQYPKNVEVAPKELPEKVRTAFDEALLCYSASAPNGCALMCRRALQETMNYFQAKKGDLPTQLADLVSKGALHPSLKDWGDHARIAGAIAGHGTHGNEWGDPSQIWVTQEDAKAVIEFCKSFFHYLFIVPAQNLERRRATGTLSATQSGTGSSAP